MDFNWKSIIKSDNGNVSAILYIFEIILPFDAWINQSSFWSTDNNDNLVVDENASLKLMMKEIRRLLPSTEKKQGWKNEKFHLLVHFINIILCFGAPKSYDSQCPEYDHKHFAKKRKMHYMMESRVETKI